MNKLKSLLVAAIAVASIASVYGQTSVTLPEAVEKAIGNDASAVAVFQNIFSRTSVRKFK